MVELTEPAKKVLQAAIELEREEGRPATQRALADRLGRTPRAISFQIERLERDGFVKRLPGRDSRNLKILRAPTGEPYPPVPMPTSSFRLQGRVSPAGTRPQTDGGLAVALEPDPDEAPPTNPPVVETLTIPVIAWAGCGKAVDREAPSGMKVQIPRRFGKECVGFLASGDSAMPRVEPNDVLVVRPSGYRVTRRQSVDPDGPLYVIHVANEGFAIKLLSLVGDRMRAWPINPKGHIPYDLVEGDYVQGVVVWVIRDREE